VCELGEFEVISGDPFVGLKVTEGAIKILRGEGVGVRPKAA